MPLTSTQKDHLLKRDEIPIAIKKNNEFAIRKQLEKFLKSISDMQIVLTHLPKKQVKRVLKDEHVYLLLGLAETAMQILEFRSIEGEIEIPEMWHVTYPITDKKTNETTFKTLLAGNKDIERSVKMDYHMSELRKYYSEKDPAPYAYRMNQDSPLMLKRGAMKIVNEFRKAIERVTEVFPAEIKPEEEPRRK